MTGRIWSVEENKKLVKLISSCSTVPEAVAITKKAFPKDEITFSSIDARVRRLGLGSLVSRLNRPYIDNKGVPNELFPKLLAHAKAGKTIEEICNAMDMSPKRLKSLVDSARVIGLSVQISGPHVGIPAKKPGGPTKSSAVAMPAGGSHVFMVASDIHIGSQHFLKAQFLDFIQRGYDKGIRLCLIPGDILDGCYRHSRWEETHHGFDSQARYAAEVLPRLPGLSYVGITGNHDETFETDAGISVVHSLPQIFRDAGRQDFSLVGARGAYLHLVSEGSRRGAFVELWHPGKGGAYALSYKLQKHIEGYAVGAKPSIVLAGHWHQQCYFTQRGVHALSCGTWHGGQSAFGRMIGGSPAIGGWYISYTQTDDGTLREFSPTWNAYYEQESPMQVSLT